MDTRFIRLRKLNVLAGLLHAASLVAILLLANDASLPVRATYMSDAPGTGKFAAPVELFSLNIGYMVAAFMALSAFFHFYVSSPTIFPKYTAGLSRHINVYRWVEYSLSSSIMIIVILQLNGVTDYIALLAVFGVNASMILFGWLQERYATPGDGDRRPFWFGCIAGAVPWIAILINLFSPKGRVKQPFLVSFTASSYHSSFSSTVLRSSNGCNTAQRESGPIICTANGSTSC